MLGLAWCKLDSIKAQMCNDKYNVKSHEEKMSGKKNSN